MTPVSMVTYYYENADYSTIDVEEIAEESDGIATLITVMMTQVARLEPGKGDLNQLKADLRVASEFLLENKTDEALQALDDFVEGYPYKFTYRIK